MSQPKPILVSCRESWIERYNQFYGRFYIGPFAFGQALTFANALRRTLLEDSVGIAITSVSIQGVNHEYSTIPGVNETVFDILLNLRAVILKPHIPLKKPILAYLQIQGPVSVKAKDLFLPSSIQCINPEQIICTLNQDKILNMKFKISMGKSYRFGEPRDLKNEQITKYENRFPEKSNLSSLKNKKKAILENLLSKISYQREVILSLFLNNQNFINKISNDVKKTNLKKLYVDSLNPIQNINNLNQSKPLKVNPNNKMSSFLHKSIKNKKFLLLSEFVDQDLSIQNWHGIENKSQIRTDWLSLDTVFMPINKINYLIENIEFPGHFLGSVIRPNECLIFEISTNGSILPQIAFKTGINTLIRLIVNIKNANFEKI
uniref:RNA polymerase subunit alpha n=1 Tax=Hydrocytium acuminatum TaxID=1745963 RepID=UPI002A834633|nr:RNA polymerase subunit alpha [Hydrocytium acuminatum]WOR09541.1 RNA polymerase subunit alpha [Hydrocytium acuminatum]